MASLEEQIASDIDAIFLATGGVGVKNAIYRSSATTREVRGVLDIAHGAVDTAYGQVSARQVTFVTAAAYWPDTFAPAVGATLEIQVDPQTASTYTIRDVQPDGTGIVTLLLELV